MITATKEEATYLRDHIKGVYIRRTMKTKSHRGTWYVEETKPVLDTLDKLRNGTSIIDKYPASKQVGA